MADEKKNIMTRTQPPRRRQPKFANGWTRGPWFSKISCSLRKWPFQSRAHPRARSPRKRLRRHGYFICTNPDMPKYTIAKLFNAVGKKLPPSFASPRRRRKGSADTEPTPRFALSSTPKKQLDMTGTIRPFLHRDL